MKVVRSNSDVCAAPQTTLFLRVTTVASVTFRCCCLAWLTMLPTSVKYSVVDIVFFLLQLGVEISLLCISTAYAVMQCVCVSVTFPDHVKTNIGNFEIFSPTDSHTILVFPCQTAWQYSNGNPPHGGIECSWGRQKSRFWAYLALVPAVSAATCQLLSTGSPVDDVTVSQVMTHRW